MNEDELLARLTTIFRDVFDDPKIELRIETTAEDIPGWDSMSQVTLAVEIEYSLGVKFKAAEMEELRSIRQLVELIMPRLPEARPDMLVRATA